MNNKTYRIRLWITERRFATWHVYAKDNQEAQERCEHLKQCCVDNGGWIPIKADIRLA